MGFENPFKECRLSSGILFILSLGREGILNFGRIDGWRRSLSFRILHSLVVDPKMLIADSFDVLRNI